MQISAEIRWFWKLTVPPGLKDWFCKGDLQGCGAGGGQVRQDDYLRDAGAGELGLKRRGGKNGIEIKGLVAVALEDLTAAPFSGPVEIWTKWTTTALKLAPEETIAVTKQRWLRKFETGGALPLEIPLNAKEMPLGKARELPARGCNVELTKVTIRNDDVWWTMGFEAFGSLTTVVNDLRAVTTTLAARQPGDLGRGVLASYPMWLREIE